MVMKQVPTMKMKNQYLLTLKIKNYGAGRTCFKNFT